MSRSCIATAYMRSWFLIDVLSVFPFDWVLPGSDSKSSEVNAVALLKSARLVRAAKMLRLLKAVKLLRLLRLPRLFRRLEYVLDRSILQLAAILGGALLLCHASACVFYAVALQLVVPLPAKTVSKLAYCHVVWNSGFAGVCMQYYCKHADRRHLNTCGWLMAPSGCTRMIMSTTRWLHPGE